MFYLAYICPTPSIAHFAVFRSRVCYTPPFQPRVCYWASCPLVCHFPTSVLSVCPNTAPLVSLSSSFVFNRVLCFGYSTSWTIAPPSPRPPFQPLYHSAHSSSLFSTILVSCLVYLHAPFQSLYHSSRPSSGSTLQLPHWPGRPCSPRCRQYGPCAWGQPC